MADDRLRLLERRWQESGSVEDEAALLGARVRAGELKRERLEFAALLGHPAAGVASPTIAACPGLTELLTRLSELHWPAAANWGRALPPSWAVCVRALISIANSLENDASRSRNTKGLAEQMGQDTDLPPPLWALEAAEEWVLCPCRKHSRRAADIGVQYRSSIVARTYPPRSRVPYLAAIAAGGPRNSGLTTVPSREEVLETCLEACDVAGLAESALYGAVTTELLPWCLGQSDPVARRQSIS